MDLLRAIEALGRPPTRPGTDLTDEPVALSAEPTGGPGPASADVLCALWASLAEPACCVMPVLGRRQWRSLRRAVDRLGGDSPDADLHRARIRAKRLRYIAEVSAPNLTGVKNRRAAAYMAKEATALQDILGEVHDAAVNEQWLREVPSRAASVTGRARTAMIVATAMAAGQLVAAVRQSERASREAWSHPWERLRRKRVRSWMDSH
jgi:CHAD domain-containing protein